MPDSSLPFPLTFWNDCLQTVRTETDALTDIVSLYSFLEVKD